MDVMQAVGPSVAPLRSLSPWPRLWAQARRGLILGVAVFVLVMPALFVFLWMLSLAFGPLAAAAILVTLPVLIVTVLVQRQIVVGMTAGAVKS